MHSCLKLTLSKALSPWMLPYVMAKFSLWSNIYNLKSRPVPWSLHLDQNHETLPVYSLLIPMTTSSSNKLVLQCDGDRTEELWIENLLTLLYKCKPEIPHPFLFIFPNFLIFSLVTRHIKSFRWEALAIFIKVFIVSDQNRASITSKCQGQNEMEVLNTWHYIEWLDGVQTWELKAQVPMKASKFNVTWAWCLDFHC